MKILVDENIPLTTVRTLLKMGHNVTDIRNTPDKGMSDDAIWAMVQQEKQLLITTDKGFVQYRYGRKMYKARFLDSGRADYCGRCASRGMSPMW